MIKIHNNFIDLCKYDPKEDAEKLSNLLSFGKNFYTWDKQYDSIISEITNKNSEKNVAAKTLNQGVKSTTKKTRSLFKTKLKPNPTAKKLPTETLGTLQLLLNTFENVLQAQNYNVCEQYSLKINRLLSTIEKSSYASAFKASLTFQSLTKKYNDLVNQFYKLSENRKKQINDADAAWLEKELLRVQHSTDGKISGNEHIITHEIGPHYPLTLFSNETRSNENDAEPIYFVIGLDIGTSFTKVVVYENYFKNVFYPVDFKSLASKDNPFLLPTRLSVTKNGQYFIPLYDENEASFTNLKLDFIQNQSTEIIPFIALVLQYVRTWFIQKYADIDAYENHSFEWLFVRAGVPFASCSQKGAEARFEVALKQALELSHKESIFKQDISQPLIAEEHPTELKCFPEIKAEIKTYETSFSREDDLHLALDIGAGTLDCSFFIIEQQLENKPFSVVSSIMPFLGAKIYEKFLSEALPKTGDCFDTTSEVKDLKYFLEKYDNQKTRDELKKRHDFFVQKCMETINTLILFVKKKLPNNLMAWQQPLKVLLLGGGRNIQVYQEVVDKIFCVHTLKSTPRQVSYIGDKLDSLEQERMFVAQGLCLDDIELQDMYYPEDFDDYGNIKQSLEISKNG